MVPLQGVVSLQRLAAALALSGLLSGCGLGGTGAAGAAGASAETQQAAQARQTEERVRADIDAAQDQAAERRRAAEDAAR
ncbi:MAG TPA: hypothetical protein VEU54_05190 [Steroidobacteraceae bacterium]|jgi:hypothetical protein|nr:hypothetical protein [Steroidobacteraceae bacterium]